MGRWARFVGALGAAAGRGGHPSCAGCHAGAVLLSCKSRSCCFPCCVPSCSFVYGTGKSWPSRYKCPANGVLQCSADNRAIAQCSIASALTTVREFACGEWSNGAAACSTSVVNDACNNFALQTCELPSMYQYFATDADAEYVKEGSRSWCFLRVHVRFNVFSSTAWCGAVLRLRCRWCRVATGSQSATHTNSGGTAGFLDYVPVANAMWSCQHDWDAAPTNLSSPFYTSTLKAIRSRRNVGGQSSCPSCRCFQSSLQEMAAGSLFASSPVAPSCYR